MITKLKNVVAVKVLTSVSKKHEVESYTRISCIDGWRAIAVIGVLYIHASAIMKSPSIELGEVKFNPLLNLWGHGVLLFFVLSGFCFYMVMQHLEKFSFRAAINFWRKRWLRIAPAFYFCSVVYLASLLFFYNAELSYIDIINKLLFNFLFLQNHFFHAEIAGLFWSLSVEWHFYLLLPLLFPLSKKFGILKVFSIVGALSLISNLLHYGGYFFQVQGWDYSILSNLGHFSWGIMLSFIYFKKINFPHFLKTYWGFFFGIGMAYFGKSLFYSGTLEVVGQYSFLLQAFGPLLMTLGFSLMILSSLSHSKVNKLLGSKPLVALGRVSYSFYLWHGLLLGFTYDFLKPFLPANFIGVAVLMIGVLIILIPISHISYKIFEAPYFRKRS